MGFRIENYDLNELHRIAVPGAVAPSLFWLLPIGNWHPDELDALWRWFTENPSACRDFGLLLVKGVSRKKVEDSDVSLASVGAKLWDVMPVGTERFVRPSASLQDCHRALILSGGYPQPGWGVLIEWPGEPSLFESLIRKVSAHVGGDSHFADGLQVFADAANAFHCWRAFETAPKLPEITALQYEILETEKAISGLNWTRSRLERKEYWLIDQVDQKLIHPIGAFLNAEVTIQTLIEDLKSLNYAAAILAIPVGSLSEEIEPHLTTLITDPSTRGAAFKSLTDTQMKRALAACIHLRIEGIVEEGASFLAWANQTLDDIPSRITPILENLARDFAAKVQSRRGEKAQIERDYELALEHWRRDSREKRDAFHRTAERAAELQWDLGPHFLVAFEEVCREHSVWVRSIPWDPARMVGWKLMVHQVRLESQDLAVAARELSPNAAGDNLEQTSALADGSYFTDYVHHVAVSKSGFAPRVVTRDLVVRLIRPAEMVALLKKHDVTIPSEAEASVLADLLLESLGWQASDEAQERPLADCILTTSGHELAQSGNDLRIVLESFCKDVLDVIVAQLGYRQDEIWNAVDERVPNYRPSSKRKDWDEEVNHLTVGAAAMLVSALGSLAFPSRENEIKECAAGLRQLAEQLNQASHHRTEGETPLSSRDKSIQELMLLVLNRAQGVLGELPWHLHASTIYGEQPKVMSGEAWSHGSATPRLLRVILWTGNTPGPRVLLWNKTRRNPIVTDPVFVVRPQRR